MSKIENTSAFFKKLDGILARYKDCILELVMAKTGDHNIDVCYFEEAKKECLEEFKKLTGKNLSEI